MTSGGLLQIAIYLGALLLLVKPLGSVLVKHAGRVMTHRQLLRDFGTSLQQVGAGQPVLEPRHQEVILHRLQPKRLRLRFARTAMAAKPGTRSQSVPGNGTALITRSLPTTSVTETSDVMAKARSKRRTSTNWRPKG